MLQDREFRCAECGEDFVFTVGEQEFYLTKGLLHAPRRCPACRRMQRTDTRPALAGGRWERDTREHMDGADAGSKWARRQMTEIRCAQCGEVTTVPFQVRGNRPVYCGACYAHVRGLAGRESL